MYLNSIASRTHFFHKRVKHAKLLQPRKPNIWNLEIFLWKRRNIHPNHQFLGSSRWFSRMYPSKKSKKEHPHTCRPRAALPTALRLRLQRLVGAPGNRGKPSWETKLQWELYHLDQKNTMKNVHTLMYPYFFRGWKTLETSPTNLTKWWIAGCWWVDDTPSFKACLVQDVKGKTFEQLAIPPCLETNMAHGCTPNDMPPPLPKKNGKLNINDIILLHPWKLT